MLPNHPRMNWSFFRILFNFIEILNDFLSMVLGRNKASIGGDCWPVHRCHNLKLMKLLNSTFFIHLVHLHCTSDWKRKVVLHTAAIEGPESSPGCGWVTSAPKIIVGMSDRRGIRLWIASSNTVFRPPDYLHHWSMIIKLKCPKLQRD